VPMSVSLLLAVPALGKQLSDAAMPAEGHELPHAIPGSVLSQADLPSTKSQTDLPYLKLPIFAVGLPKSGSTSVLDFMNCGGFTNARTSHFSCGKAGGPPMYCGKCAHANFAAKRPLLQGCGEYDVWAEINYTPAGERTGECFFPQVSALQQLFDYAPNATWVLPTRPAQHWVDSVVSWGTMQQDLTDCDLDDLPAGEGNETAALARFYDAHTAKVRAFARRHASTLALVEVEIEHESAAARAMSAAFGIEAKCWGVSNCKSSCAERAEMQRLVSEEASAEVAATMAAAAMAQHSLQA